MQKFKELEKKTKLTNQYVNLEPLKFTVIRKINDGFVKIVDNTKIRRDESWRTASQMK